MEPNAENQTRRTSESNILEKNGKKSKVEWKLAKQLSTEKVTEALYHARKIYYQQKPNFLPGEKNFIVQLLRSRLAYLE